MGQAGLVGVRRRVHDGEKTAVPEPIFPWVVGGVVLALIARVMTRL